MQHVASYSYQYTEYKHVAMANRNYTTVCILRSNKVICSLSFHEHFTPLIQHHIAADRVHALVVSFTKIPACYDLQIFVKKCCMINLMCISSKVSCFWDCGTSFKN